MRILLRDGAQRKLRKLKKRYPDVLKLLDEAFEVYRQNPRSSKLRVHKLSGIDNMWSISLRQDLRVTFSFHNEVIMIENIGGHDEVYR